MNLVIVTSNELYFHSYITISFTLLYTSLGMDGLSIWLQHSLPHINGSKSNFWIAQSLFSILQSLTHPVNFSIQMLVGAISISSFFSFWKLDYFSDMNCLKNPLSDMISCSSSTQLITSDIRVRYWPRIYSLNINSIPIGEIPTKGFPVCVLYNLRKSLH